MQEFRRLTDTGAGRALTDTGAGRALTDTGAGRALTDTGRRRLDDTGIFFRAGVHILLPDYLAVVQQGKKLEELAHLNQTAEQTLDQLVWWTRALKAARDSDAATADARAA